jgi:hypothetical protein
MTTAKIKWHASRPRKALPRDNLLIGRRERLRYGPNNPTTATGSRSTTGSQRLLWFLIFLLIAVVLVGIIIFLSVIGILGALFG